MAPRFLISLLVVGLIGTASPALGAFGAIPASSPTRPGEIAVAEIGDRGALEPGSFVSTAPHWPSDAMDFVTQQGYVTRRQLNVNRPVARRTFKRMMAKAFGGGYSKTSGKVKAREVDAALVRALGRASAARQLASIESPNGWDPRISLWDGHEMVAREMGLRHDRPTSEEAFESSAKEPMLGADVAYAVWRAKVGPNHWGADELENFSLDNIKGVRKRVVRFAFDQVGLPYIWGGEWAQRTPAGYPYGAQAHGGVDCSGLVWYVLRAEAPNWHPKKRPYRGWSLADRSSSGMAAGTNNKIGYKSLKTGDIMMFASGGRSSGASGVYHAGIYLGRGWMIDSAGSQAGVGLSYVGRGSWWRDQFVWGRRVIK